MPPSDMDAVVETLRAGDRFVVTSHDNPDGDALGSLLATHLALGPLGKDSVMVLGGPQPLAGEYAFLRLGRARPPTGGARGRRRARARRRGLRTGEPHRRPGALDSAALSVNVDHHHDNTRFGAVNLVVDDASSTAEVLADVFDGLGVERTPAARRGPLHGDRHRHRPVPVLEHDAEGAPPRGGARRGRRGRQKVFVEVYESTPFPSSSCWRARSSTRRSSPTGASSSPSCAGRTSRRPGRRSPTRRASSTTSARSTAPSSSRSSASCRRWHRRRKGSLRARIRTASTSRRSPATSGAAGIAAPRGSRTDLTMDEITRRIVDAFARGERRPPRRCPSRRGSSRPA